MTNPNDPSQPTIENGINGEVTQGFGLTKREYFAALALQGLSANSFHKNLSPDSVAKWSVKCADSLINELNQ